MLVGWHMVYNAAMTFDPDRPCPVCLSEPSQQDWQYVQMPYSLYDNGYGHGVRRTCLRCGFIWHEAVVILETVLGIVWAEKDPTLQQS